jgi:hypothetical protein
MDPEAFVLTAYGFKKARFLKVGDALLQPNQSINIIKSIDVEFLITFKKLQSNFFVASGTKVQYGQEFVVVDEHPFYHEQELKSVLSIKFEVPGLIITSDLSIFYIK